MGFPVPTPAPGTTYSVGNRIWTFDGFGWRFLGASGSTNVTLSGLNNYIFGITAPLSPINGDKWFHTIDGIEYTFIKDVDNTSHWIEIGYGCPTFGGINGGFTGINFPNPECIGDTYSYDGRVWIYNGYAWKMVCQNTGDSEFTFGLTAPSNPNPGHRWVDSASGVLFTFVNDYDPIGQTGQWVAFDNGSEIIGPQGVTGEPGPPGPPGAPGSGKDILGTENQIIVSVTGSTATISLPSLIVATAMSVTEAAATQYYGTNMELYGSIDLPYGNLNAPAGTVTSLHHEGNLRLGGIEVQVRNISGTTLQKGTPVYVVDDINASTYVDVARSYADNYPTVPMIGLLAQDLSNNAIGYAISQGILNSINTSSITPGQSLWVATTTSTGVTYGLTINEPTGITAYKQRAGVVLRSHQTDGMIYVFGGDAFGKAQPNSVSINSLIGEAPPQSILFNLIGGAGSGSVWSAWELYRLARGPSTPNYLNVSVFDPGVQTGGPITFQGVIPGTPTTKGLFDQKFAAWDNESENWVPATGGKGLKGTIVDGLTYSLELDYAFPGITGLTFNTVSKASGTDKVLIQQTSGNMRLISVSSLINSPIFSTVPQLTTDVTGYRFAFYDGLGEPYESTSTTVKNFILEDNITSLNGCTGAVGITGTTGEVEVTKNCPNIVIGLPDNVTITGNLTVGGLYFGLIDGGTFE